jgi:hypothetical protein
VQTPSRIPKTLFPPTVGITTLNVTVPGKCKAHEQRLNSTLNAEQDCSRIHQRDLGTRIGRKSTPRRSPPLHASSISCGRPKRESIHRHKIKARPETSCRRYRSGSQECGRSPTGRSKHRGRNIRRHVSAVLHVCVPCCHPFLAENLADLEPLQSTVRCSRPFVGPT